MFRPGQTYWQSVALDRRDSSGWHDFVPAADRWRYCGSVLEMKKRAAIIGVIVLLLLMAAFYLWGPSSVPRGQPPRVTLSNVNFSEFENAFDADANVLRLVLLLSPT